MLPESLNSLYRDLNAVGSSLGVPEAAGENRASLIAHKVLIHQERTSDGKMSFHAEKKPWGWAIVHAIQRLFHISPKEEYNFKALIDNVRAEYSAISGNLSTKATLSVEERDKMQFLTEVLNNLIDHVNERKIQASQTPLQKLVWQETVSTTATLIPPPPLNLKNQNKDRLEGSPEAKAIVFSLNAVKAKMRNFDKLDASTKEQLVDILHKVELIITNPDLQKIKASKSLAPLLEQHELTPEKLTARLQEQRHDLAKVHQVLDVQLEKVSKLGSVVALAEELEKVQLQAKKLQENPLFTHIFTAAGQFLAHIGALKVSYALFDDIQAQAEMLCQCEEALEALADIPVLDITSRAEIREKLLQTKEQWEVLGKRSFGGTWTNVLRSKAFENFVKTIEKPEYWNTFLSLDKAFLGRLKPSENQLEAFVMPLIALSKSLKTVLSLYPTLREGLAALGGQASFAKRDLYTEHTRRYQNELQEIKKIKVPVIESVLPKSVQAAKIEVQKNHPTSLWDAVDRLQGRSSSDAMDASESDSDDWK